MTIKTPSGFKPLNIVLDEHWVGPVFPDPAEELINYVERNWKDVAGNLKGLDDNSTWIDADSAKLWELVWVDDTGVSLHRAYKDRAQPGAPLTHICVAEAFLNQAQAAVRNRAETGFLKLAIDRRAELIADLDYFGLPPILSGITRAAPSEPEPQKGAVPSPAGAPERVLAEGKRIFPDRTESAPRADEAQAEDADTAPPVEMKRSVKGRMNDDKLRQIMESKKEKSAIIPAIETVYEELQHSNAPPTRKQVATMHARVWGKQRPGPRPKNSAK